MKAVESFLSRGFMPVESLLRLSKPREPSLGARRPRAWWRRCHGQCHFLCSVCANYCVPFVALDGRMTVIQSNRM